MVKDSSEITIRSSPVLALSNRIEPGSEAATISPSGENVTQVEQSQVAFWISSLQATRFVMRQKTVTRPLVSDAASFVPSGENATHFILRPVLKVVISCNDGKSHSLTVSSQLADANLVPSGEKSTELTES